ncbi:Ferric/Cupric Reductase Transmembrane Component, partial [Abortiporus biennis]
MSRSHDLPRALYPRQASPASDGPAPDDTMALVNWGIKVYPQRTWIVVCSIIAAAFLYNVLYSLWSYHRRHTSQQHKSSSLTRLSASILTAFRIVSFRWRLPVFGLGVFDVLLTSAYIILLFTCCFVNTQGLNPELWCKRAGAIAAAQIPLIVALSSKNNIIGWLTGVGHEKLNVLHRMFARVTLVLIFVHWAGMHSPSSGVDMSIPFPVWPAAGKTAAIVFTILAVISVQWIRKLSYEIFYLGHMALVLAFIVSVWIHLDGTGHANLVYPGAIFWALDRFLRYSHYVINNPFWNPRKSLGRLELLGEDTMRLTIRRCWFGFAVHFGGWTRGWKAGQHMFVAFPSINPTQSHPFSISTIPNDLGSDEDELVFIIRVREGLTRTLKERLVLEARRRNGLSNGKSFHREATSAQVKSTMDIPVFLDGPYGNPTDITGFERCVFVAGGSGITYIFPRFLDIVIRATKNQACARNVLLIWIVRERSQVEWISKHISRLSSIDPRQNNNKEINVRFSVYVTSKQAKLDQYPTTGSKIESASTPPSLYPPPPSPYPPSLSPTATAAATPNMSQTPYYDNTPMAYSERSSRTEVFEKHDDGEVTRSGSPVYELKEIDQFTKIPLQSQSSAVEVSEASVPAPPPTSMISAVFPPPTTATSEGFPPTFEFGVGVEEATRGGRVQMDFYQGRPDIKRLLGDEIGRCREGESVGGGVSVDVSGPEALVASVRMALSS